MKVFLSWSKEPARSIARALRDLVDMLCKEAHPWISEVDIPKGERWSNEVADALGRTNVGIVVVTPFNVSEPWLLFEAGALAKSVDTGRVHPFLVGVDMRDLPQPLAQFQATRFDRADVLSMLLAINALQSSPASELELGRRFEGLWPQFKTDVESALAKAMELHAHTESSTPPSSAPKTEGPALEQDHLTILEVLARANGRKIGISEVARIADMTIDRAQFRLDELVEADYVSMLINMMSGAAYGLGNLGRRLAIEKGWI